MSMEGLSNEFLEALANIRIARAEPNPPPPEPLDEVEHYFDSLHFRMVQVAGICGKVFPNDSDLAECLAIFKEDIKLLASLGELVTQELERKLKKPQ
jgi:hypothetical protein